MRHARFVLPDHRTAKHLALRLWQPVELQRLRELASNGAGLARIAADLGRTQSAVKNKAAMHGISLAAAGAE